MADFSTEAELSIVVPRRELRSARQEVEDALAEVPVGMSASGGAGGGGTNAAREQRRRRREFRWARQRTDDTEAQLEVLENIEGELTEGGLGGGGGIFGDLLGLGGEGAGIATDLGTSVVDAVAPALGSLVGTFVGQKASDATGGGGGGDLQIQEPLGVTVENTPLDVEDGSDVSVSVDAPDVTPVFEPDFEPTFQPTFRPDFSTDLSVSPELDLPEFDFSSESGVTEPVDVIVTNTPLSVDGRASTEARRRPTQNQPSRQEGILETAGGVLDDIGAGVVNSIPGVDRPGLSRDISEGGKPINRPFESVGRILDAPGRTIVDLFELDNGGRRGSTNGAGVARPDISASTGDVNVTVNADVQSAVQSTVDELRREQEQQRQELRRELENEIQDLRRQISGGSGRGRIR